MSRITRTLIQSIKTSASFEIVSVDYLHLEKSKGGEEYELMVVNHFTKYAHAYATKYESREAASRKLSDDFIMCFGFPSQINHNQGKEFENNLFHKLPGYRGIRYSPTSPNHPQSNPAERFNTTLLGILYTLEETLKSKWKEQINKVICAYNSSVHESTGFSPFFVLFGHEPSLPVKQMFPRRGQDRN